MVKVNGNTEYDEKDTEWVSIPAYTRTEDNKEDAIVLDELEDKKWAFPYDSIGVNEKTITFFRSTGDTTQEALCLFFTSQYSGVPHGLRALESIARNLKLDLDTDDEKDRALIMTTGPGTVEAAAITTKAGRAYVKVSVNSQEAV